MSSEADEKCSKSNLSEESLSDQSLRLWTTIVVFLVLTVFGLPLWWSTTAVYRATLPTQEINDLSTMKIVVAVDLEFLVDDEQLSKKTELQTTIQTLLEEDKLSEPYIKYTVSFASQPSWVKDGLERGVSLQDLVKEAPSAVRASALDMLKYTVILQHIAGNGNGGASVAIGAHQYILAQYGSDGTTPGTTPGIAGTLKLVGGSIHRVAVSHKQAHSSYIAGSGLPSHNKDSRGNLMAVTSTPGYRLAFTLVNSNPDLALVDWDMRNAIESHFQPFLDQVSSLGDFTIDTQVLHYVSSDVKPTRDGNSFYLAHEQLPHMVNPLESALGSHSSNLSSLHFVVYIPSMDQSPLLILDESGSVAANNSFVVHRWGSLVVHNLDSASTVAGSRHVLCRDSMAKITTIFSAHLKLLLGIPKLESDLPAGLTLSAGSTSVATWEWNNLLLSRTVENVARTRATLQALVKLLDDVSNMVIADHIQQAVVRAVHLIDQCLNKLSTGHLTGAYSLSQSALVASEKAFFDPSMLALLYFPQDSLYAIYVPLFIPMAVPVLASLVQSVKLYKQLRNANQQLKTQQAQGGRLKAE